MKPVNHLRSISEENPRHLNNDKNTESNKKGSFGKQWAHHKTLKWSIGSAVRWMPILVTYVSIIIWCRLNEINMSKVRVCEGNSKTRHTFERSWRTYLAQLKLKITKLISIQSSSKQLQYKQKLFKSWCELNMNAWVCEGNYKMRHNFERNWKKYLAQLNSK